MVGEFGSERPMDIRNDFYRVLYEELAKAKTQGLPAAGVLLPTAGALLNQAFKMNHTDI